MWVCDIWDNIKSLLLLIKMLNSNIFLLFSCKSIFPHFFTFQSTALEQYRNNLVDFVILSVRFKMENLLGNSLYFSFFKEILMSCGHSPSHTFQHLICSSFQFHLVVLYFECLLSHTVVNFLRAGIIENPQDCQLFWGQCSIIQIVSC